VTSVPIPGDDVPLDVLEFEQGASGHGDPPVVIDHGHMVSSLTAWVKKGGSTVCVINGLVKTGKTTALTKVLPQLVRTHFPKALFCHLDFNTFMRPGSSAEETAASLMLALESWAKANGFPSQPHQRDYGYEGTKSNIYSLMDMFARSDHTIYFLIDEVRVSQDTLPSLFPVPSFTQCCHATVTVSTLLLLHSATRVRSRAVRCALPHAVGTAVPSTVAPRRSSRGTCPPLRRFSGSFKLPTSPTGPCSRRCCG